MKILLTSLMIFLMSTSVVSAKSASKRLEKKVYESIRLNLDQGEISLQEAQHLWCEWKKLSRK